VFELSKGLVVIIRATNAASLAHPRSASQLTLLTTGAEKVEFFFRDPAKMQSGQSGFISTLYLLRNDIRTMDRIAPNETSAVILSD
jgi:hypothetical protein